MAGIVNKVKLAIFRLQDSNVHVKSAGLVFCEVPTIQEPGSGYVTIIIIIIIIIIKIIIKIGTIELITTIYLRNDVHSQFLLIRTTEPRHRSLKNNQERFN